MKLSDITIVTIDFYPQILAKYLLPSLPKEAEFIKLENVNNENWKSAAKALNFGIKKAKNDVVICAHNDLILGKNWFRGFIKQESKLKKWGCLGIVGVELFPGGKTRKTWGRKCSSSRPVKVVDECCLIINRKNDLWFDQTLGDTWHCYGIDFCYQCYDKGLGVYILAGMSDHARGGTSVRKIPRFKIEKTNAMIRLQEKWKDKFPVIYHT